MASNPVAAALASAHKALDNANKFQHGVTGGKPDLAAKSDSKPQASAPDYSHAREARKEPGEFMGVRSNQASEINDALATREANKKALEPNQ